MSLAKNKRKIAFTLIELLVVIAIIGILSGLIVVSMGGMTTKATIAKAQVFSNSLRNSLMINLIAEYKLDGDAIDSWGGHSAGTIYGVTPYSSCVQNSCYSFDGTNSRIELSDSLDLRMATGGTISTWIYPKSFGGSNTGVIIEKGTDVNGSNGYMFILYSSNRVRLQINNGTELFSLANVVNLNQWQLATITFNSSGRKVYINGIDVTASGGNQTALPPNVAGIVRIGQRTYDTGETFDGYIDEVRMYNAAIPASQIREQYYAGLNSLFIAGKISKEEYVSKIVDNSIANKNMAR